MSRVSKPQLCAPALQSKICINRYFLISFVCAADIDHRKLSRRPCFHSNGPASFLSEEGATIVFGKVSRLILPHPSRLFWSAATRSGWAVETARHRRRRLRQQRVMRWPAVVFQRSVDRHGDHAVEQHGARRAGRFCRHLHERRRRSITATPAAPNRSARQLAFQASISNYTRQCAERTDLVMTVVAQLRNRRRTGRRLEGSVTLPIRISVYDGEDSNSYSEVTNFATQIDQAWRHPDPVPQGQHQAARPAPARWSASASASTRARPPGQGQKEVQLRFGVGDRGCDCVALFKESEVVRVAPSHPPAGTFSRGEEIQAGRSLHLPSPHRGEGGEKGSDEGCVKRQAHAPSTPRRLSRLPFPPAPRPTPGRSAIRRIASHAPHPSAGRRARDRCAGAGKPITRMPAARAAWTPCRILDHRNAMARSAHLRGAVQEDIGLRLDAIGAEIAWPRRCSARRTG